MVSISRTLCEFRLTNVKLPINTPKGDESKIMERRSSLLIVNPQMANFQEFWYTSVDLQWHDVGKPIGEVLQLRFRTLKKWGVLPCSTIFSSAEDLGFSVKCPKRFSP